MTMTAVRVSYGVSRVPFGRSQWASPVCERDINALGARLLCPLHPTVSLHLSLIRPLVPSALSPFNALFFCSRVCQAQLLYFHSTIVFTISLLFESPSYSAEQFLRYIPSFGN